MFKVWSHDRQQKKLVSASSVQELVQKGNKSRVVVRKPRLTERQTDGRTDDLP